MRSEKILLVDDEPDQLAVRSLLLLQHGWTSLLAETPKAALELASAERPQCIVMDLRLPTTQAGLRLIRDLKRDNPDTRIIILTGRVRAAGEAPELALVEEVVEKGAPVRELLSVIGAACDRAKSVGQHTSTMGTSESSRADIPDRFERQ